MGEHHKGMLAPAHRSSALPPRISRRGQPAARPNACPPRVLQHWQVVTPSNRGLPCPAPGSPMLSAWLWAGLCPGCGEADAAAAAERQLDRGNQSGAGPDNGDGYGITEEDRAMDASIAKDLFQPRVVPARPGARHARGYTASRGMGRGRK